MNPEIRLSIDPYVESGGVLGNRLEVQSSAVRLLGGIELRRDVEISVFDFDKATNQDVMGLDLSSRSVLSFGENWGVGILDRRIASDVEEWMKDNYSRDEGMRGNELFEERYVGQLNEEIMERIKVVSKISGNERFFGNLGGSVYAYIGLGSTSVLAHICSQELIENFLAMSSATEDSGGRSVIGVTLGLGGLAAAGGIGLKIIDGIRSLTLREKASLFVPFFEIGSRIRTAREFRNFDGEFVALKPHLISSSSTSNMRSASGGMTSPAPSSPYPMV